jgi:hypothetical protein
MHQILKNRVLPTMAGAAIVVGGLNVASYAGNGHTKTHGTRAGADSSAEPFVSSARAVAGLAAKVKGHVYRYTIPKHTAMPFGFQMVNLPQGRYAVSLDIASQAATGPVTPFCNVADSGSQYAVVSYGQDLGTTTDDIAINSASGIIRAEKKGEAAIFCNQADGTYNSGGSKNVVVFTPIGKVSTLRGKNLHPPMMRSPQSGFGH